MTRTKALTISGIISLSLSAYANDGITPYIVGGVDSKALELPWQVYLEIEKNGATYACGGTLITDTWVVTAAHCLNESDNRLTFSTINADQVTVYSGGIDRTSSGNMSGNVVTNLIAHTGYGQANNADDIALLKLSLPVALPALPIKLMSNTLQTDADAEFDNGFSDNLVVSGWGRTSADRTQTTDILKKTIVTGVNDSACALIWRFYGLKSNFICANAYGRGSCNGDSGGPLIWQDKSAISDNDRGYRLAGVVSFGHLDQCADYAYPDVFTEVNHYSVWIKTEIEKIDGPGSYQSPQSSFNQDIFVMDESPMPSESSGGGIGYTFLALLTGLLVYRRKN